jgi:hypothetical protein
MPLSPQALADLGEQASNLAFEAMQRVTALADDPKDKFLIALAGASGAVGVVAGHLILAGEEKPTPELMRHASMQVLDCIRASLDKYGNEAVADSMRRRGL